MVVNSSRGYTSSARISNAPGAYYEVLSTEFGVSGVSMFTVPTLAISSTGFTATVRASITWITKVGESLPTQEATLALTAQGLQVTIPAVPSTGATVIGWSLYTSTGAPATPQRNTVQAAFTTGTLQTFSTSEGPIVGFPIATTVVVDSGASAAVGTGNFAPQIDLSGTQAGMPFIPQASTVDYFFRVANTGNKWHVQKSVEWMRPAGLAEPAGIVIGPADIVAPVYPGTSTTIAEAATLTGPPVVPVSPTYMVLNGIAYAVLYGGTTASTFIGAAAFQNKARYTTVTDGTVTWISLGQAKVVRFHFGNTTAAAIIPAVQEWDLFAA